MNLDTPFTFNVTKHRSHFTLHDKICGMSDAKDATGTGVWGEALLSAAAT